MDLSIAKARLMVKDLQESEDIGGHLYTLHISRVSVETLEKADIEDALEDHRHHPLFADMVKELLARFDRISKGEEDAWNTFLEEEFKLGQKNEEKVVPKEEKRKFALHKEREIKKISTGRIQKKSTRHNSSANDYFKKMDFEERQKMMEEDRYEIEWGRGETVHPNFFRRYEEDQENYHEEKEIEKTSTVTIQKKSFCHNSSGNALFKTMHHYEASQKLREEDRRGDTVCPNFFSRHQEKQEDRYYMNFNDFYAKH